MAHDAKLHTNEQLELPLHRVVVMKSKCECGHMIWDHNLEDDPGCFLCDCAIYGEGA